MRAFSLVLVLIIVIFLIQGVILLRTGKSEKIGRQIFRTVVVFCWLYGSLAFFLPSFSLFNGISFLPSWFEWPIGKVSGVVQDSSGRYFAPHTPSGRIQVYDRNKNFISGWMVETGGGAFELRLAENGLIEVFTARGNRHYFFKPDGTLVRQTTYKSGAYPDIAPESQLTMKFKTPFFLLPLSSPGYAWGLAALGMILFAAFFGIPDAKTGKLVKLSSICGKRTRAEKVE